MPLIDTASMLQVAGDDMENYCLSAPCGEKAWAVAGSEFRDKEGMKTLMKKSLCSINTSGRKLRKMGFAPVRYDNNVRVKPREDGPDCESTYADDFFVIAKDSASHKSKIKEAFSLRS